MSELVPLPPQPTGLAFPTEDWPAGEPEAAVDAVRLRRLAGLPFEQTDRFGETLAVLAVHRGRLVFERYGDGYGPSETYRSWSMAKSLTHALIGMLVVLPALTIWSAMVAIGAAGLYVSTTLDITLAAFVFDVIGVLTPSDIAHGMIKAVVFAVLIVLIGVVNGIQVEGGAAGVGKVTTRSVVQSISCIIIFDMIIGLLITPS